MPAAGMPGPLQSGASSSQPLRPIGVVTEIQSGLLTLHTDAGPNLAIHLPEGVSVARVPPGAKSLKSATKIGVDDISIGDRVLVLGPVSADQKSVLAKSVIVMSKTALAKAREAEQLDWERRGIGGVVKSLDPAAREIVIAVPNTPPTPGNPTHPVTLSLEPQAKLLRYAPDSIKFSDAKPGTFGEIKVGDQVRALGNKSADGTHFTAEKLVSGTFRNIGATVMSVDATQGTITVKDLATGKPLLVRTDADSQLHQLPPFLAQMIARFNSGRAAGDGAPGQPENGARGKAPRTESRQGPGGSGEHENGMRGGGHGSGPGGMPTNFQQMLDQTPLLALSALRPGEPLIVVSTAGAKPSEVTAIAVLSGVEPILQARPKGSSSVVLGPWNMSLGGGGGGGGEETGP
jgi:hypothetical protein